MGAALCCGICISNMQGISTPKMVELFTLILLAQLRGIYRVSGITGLSGLAGL